MAQLQIRRGAAGEWTAVNPVLASGELGVEIDTFQLKVGNGVTPWSGLPYVGRFSDVAEYDNLASFPVAGARGILYVARDTNLLYRWATTMYVTVGDATGGVNVATLNGIETLTNKTLVNPHVNTLWDDNGNPILHLNSVADAVNFAVVQNHKAGNWPSILVDGTDQDIHLGLNPKGSGAVIIFVPTGQAAKIAAAGADEDVDVNLITKGRGLARVNGIPIVDTVSVKKYAPGQRICVLDRVNGPIFGALSDGTKQGMAWRFVYPVIKSGHSLEFTFSNIYNNGGPEVDGPNTLTFFAAVEDNDGSVIPLTPAGGTTLLPGQQVRMAANLDVVAGQRLYLRTQVAVATLGQKWGRGSNIYYTLGGTVADGVLDTSAAPFADITTSAAASSFVYTGGLTWGPMAITAIVEETTPSVLIVGTSIAYGIGNISEGADQSYITKALKAAGIPFQNVAMPSSSALMFSTLAGSYRKMAAVSGTRHTHAICEHITNDAPSATLTVTKAAQIASWRRLAAQGLKVWATTGMPITDATNTTPNNGNPNRIGYNNWLRDGAPMTSGLVAAAIGATGVLRAGQAGHPLTGYFEIADTVESARDSGLWKPGRTDDGVHPNTTGHGNAVAGIDTTKLVLT